MLSFREFVTNSLELTEATNKRTGVTTTPGHKNPIIFVNQSNQMKHAYKKLNIKNDDLSELSHAQVAAYHQGMLNDLHKTYKEAVANRKYGIGKEYHNYLKRGIDYHQKLVNYHKSKALKYDIKPNPTHKPIPKFSALSKGK